MRQPAKRPVAKPRPLDDRRLDMFRQALEAFPFAVYNDVEDPCHVRLMHRDAAEIPDDDRHVEVTFPDVNSARLFKWAAESGELLALIHWQRERMLDVLERTAVEHRPCSSCGAKLWLVMHANGKKTPYTADGLNHFVDCASRDAHRR